MVLGQKSSVLALIRKRMVSDVEGWNGPAIIAIGICGKKSDIVLLKRRIEEVKQRTTTTERDRLDQQSLIYLLKQSVKKIEDRAEHV